MSGVSYQAARQSDAGLLYGTTSLGGYNGSPCNACGTVYAIFGGSSSCSGHCGVVFKVNALGNEQVVYAFEDQSDGSNPKGELLWTSKRLYGTASTGGSGREGTLFSLDSSGKFRTLHAFTGAHMMARSHSGTW